MHECTCRHAHTHTHTLTGKGWHSHVINTKFACYLEPIGAYKALSPIFPHVFLTTAPWNSYFYI